MKDHADAIKMVLDALTDSNHGVIASMEEISAVEDERLLCSNPRCISSTEQELPHKFKLVDEAHGIYRCIYCEAKKTLD